MKDFCYSSQSHSIRFKSQYDVNKIEFYCNTKDKTTVLSNSFVVYNFSCPGCGANYIGKTERALYERAVEHTWTDNNSTIYKHLNDCTGVQNSDKFDLRTTRINSVQNNTEIVDRHKNWNILLFKEALKLKELKPILNSGLKASKELQLFGIDENVIYT